MKYIITGGRQLNGRIKVSGNKNSVFPCIAAALLTEEEVILDNVSQLRDTQVLIQILQKLGVRVKRDGLTLFIKAQEIRHFSLPKDLMIRLRGSIVLVGAMLGRAGKVYFTHPGGDIIGKRSIETHLKAFKALGAVIKKENLKHSINLDNKKIEPADIFLKEASVTATENLILAASLGQKTLILRNCAKEPHVVDLCKLLISMGAKIEGVGTDVLKITGVDKLYGTKFRIRTDYIEVGTYAVAAAITGGRIQIEGIDDTDLDSILIPLQEFGINIEKKGEFIDVWASKLKSPVRLTTNIWPGFPTDMMSVAIVLATQSKGVILCHDWMYESRMFFVDKLISMGANITLADPHRCLVYGPTKLKGRSLETPDIRAGMALLLASLVAKGESSINQAELIERGYEDVVEKVSSLGAQIERVELN